MKILILISAVVVVNCLPQRIRTHHDPPLQWVVFPLRLQSQPQPSLQLTTPSQILDIHPSTQIVTLPFTSTYIDLKTHTNSYRTETVSNTETSEMEDSTEYITKYTNDRVISTTETTKTARSKPIISAVVQEVNLEQLISPNKTSSALTNLNGTDNSDATKIIPYKSHPLFHYLKNKNTLTKDKIIQFRNDEKNGGEIATLILKPVAKAVAGDDGKAMAMTLSRAILKQGTNVDVFYEPEAVAIAGPGGIAHAQTDLEVFYQDEEV
ncbi:hypothetical protein ILUMI_21977 [Ignelater luminosus]|uniref:DUF4774 domain-containing protein n=1 Tax=Ignelater luminosus TaxID=2038154 RepID=A0A8K0CB14_IGNLU|nr:hypothetical protein ILUMI_21977 [Ignelater luminosus]